jgi:hypothetical protein
MRINDLFEVKFWHFVKTYLGLKKNGAKDF